MRIDRPENALTSLLYYGGHAGVALISRLFSRDQCSRWANGVHDARAQWTSDFDGEQFSLGRAFYTHFEEGKSEAYFADVASSDARVERHAPGLQQAMRDLVATVTGGRARQRRGWCGPGIHVFPPKGPVSKRGGVLHFDTEGLAAHHIAARRPAITIVAMLQVPQARNLPGLRVWNVRYSGHDHPTDEEREAESATVAYEEGDGVLIDSYRLHQIQPFAGDRERISATVHAAEVDPGHWECWF